jgi:UV DNA damage endonuclease
MRLGYACLNTALREKGIFCSRTARSETIREKGIEYAEELFDKNLDDLFVILEYNEKHGIRFYRLSSEMMPHLSNPEFIAKSKLDDPRALSYNIKKYKNKLRAIGDYAKAHGHRLTFHPGQFVVIGTPDPKVFNNSARELYAHALVLDLMGLDYNSVMIVHGGGIYCDKPKTILRWGENFDKLPIEVKRRLVLENDEYCYSADDVLQISASLPKFQGCGKRYRIPIVFDMFHYDCMNRVIKQKNVLTKTKIADCHSCMIPPQRTIAELLPSIIESWYSRTVKMHISEQGRGPLGKHAYYVSHIPQWVLQLSKKIKIDLMVEAKGKELAVKRLTKLHKNYLI